VIISASNTRARTRRNSTCTSSSNLSPTDASAMIPPSGSFPIYFATVSAPIRVAHVLLDSTYVPRFTLAAGCGLWVVPRRIGPLPRPSDTTSRPEHTEVAHSDLGPVSRPEARNPNEVRMIRRPWTETCDPGGGTPDQATWR
jgi:hypothetical protein